MFSGDPDQSLPHGGDLAAARRLFIDVPEPFLDLSTGINPNSYPLPQLPIDLFARLPEADALAAAKTAAAQAYGAPSAAHVVAAPGTQILLPLVAALVRPSRAAVGASRPLVKSWFIHAYSTRTHPRPAAASGTKIHSRAIFVGSRRKIHDRIVKSN